MAIVRTTRAGIISFASLPGEMVAKGDILARIYDTCDDTLLEELHAPASGVLFFSIHHPLVLENTIAFRIIETDE